MTLDNLHDAYYNRAMSMIPDKLRHESWPQQRQRHALEQYLLVRCALEAEGWSQTRAARRLGCQTSALARVLERHPDLLEQVQAHNPGPGRPKSLKSQAK